MQPNQPDFDPNQPIAQPQPQTQPQPAAPQYEAPATTAAPFEALVTTSPLDTSVPPAQPQSFTRDPQTAVQPTNTAFAPSPVEPQLVTADTAPVVSSPSPAPAPTQKASHKALFIILAAVTGLVIVVAGVYLAVTLTAGSN